ncbi:hypothetical protein E1301_Tti019617 [Triplophysa tibetana]|uniref:Uncharacterized protein n=1 Tax=Triplophysa tibetana TaxID=1572043 RepID=A0A5A9PJ61_9TELE|nr:hypothetical protein E1301_Tti019617 [Triplophysa tibetana]
MSHIVSECVAEDPDGMPPPVGERSEERIGGRSAREHLAGGFTFAEFPISLNAANTGRPRGRSPDVVDFGAVATNVTARVANEMVAGSRRKTVTRDRNFLNDNLPAEAQTPNAAIVSIPLLDEGAAPKRTAGHAALENAQSVLKRTF